MTSVPIVAARGVSKSFFGNRVLSDVSIALAPGRIHALLGENGAGKSTLINLLSGALVPDSGSIEVDGRSVRSLTPSEARRAGIAVVQQELGLTSDLSVAEIADLLGCAESTVRVHLHRGRQQLAMVLGEEQGHVR